MVNNIPKQKIPGPYGFAGEIYQIIKEKIAPISSNFLKEIEAECILSNWLYEASITLIPKSHRTLQEWKTIDQYLLWT